MFKKILLLGFVALAALLVLRQFDVRTGSATVDRPIARLNAWLHYSLQAPQTEADSDETEHDSLESVLGFIQDGVEDLESELSIPARNKSVPIDNPTPHRDESFVVQVAAFSDLGNAERLASKLRDYDFDAKIDPRQGDLYTVRMGPFRERRIAEEAVFAVKQATIGLSPFVTTPAVP